VQNEQTKVVQNNNSINTSFENNKNCNSLDSVDPVGKLSDFLSAEANDGPCVDLNALDSVVDVKPVTMFSVKNVHTNKILKKPLMVLLDTGSEKSVIKSTHSQHGNVKKGQTI
jgi:hypothetical protein